MDKIRTSLIGVTVAAIVALAAFPTVSAALQSAARPASCLRNQLGVRANGINGAAGTIHGAWVFTNVSAKACDLDGYPDIQLYGRRGRPIPTTVKRNLPPAPSHVKLLPGGSATFYSSYKDVPSGSAACPTSRHRPPLSFRTGLSTSCPSTLTSAWYTPGSKRPNCRSKAVVTSSKGLSVVR